MPNEYRRTFTAQETAQEYVDRKAVNFVQSRFDRMSTLFDEAESDSMDVTVAKRIMKRNMKRSDAKTETYKLTNDDTSMARMTKVSYINLTEGQHAAQAYANEHLPGFEIDWQLTDEHGALFRNKASGELVLAYRGTQHGADWDTNLRFGTGMEKGAKQLHELDSQMSKIRSKYQRLPDRLTGHSKGGGQAIHMGEKYGIPTVTQDPITPFKDMNPFKGDAKAEHKIIRTPEDWVSANSHITKFRKGVSVHNITATSKDILGAHDLNLMTGEGAEDYLGRGNTKYNPVRKNDAYVADQISQGKSFEQIMKTLRYPVELEASLKETYDRVSKLSADDIRSLHHETGYTSKQPTAGDRVMNLASGAALAAGGAATAKVARVARSFDSNTIGGLLGGLGLAHVLEGAGMGPKKAGFNLHDLESGAEEYNAAFYAAVGAGGGATGDLAQQAVRSIERQGLTNVPQNIVRGASRQLMSSNAQRAVSSLQSQALLEGPRQFDRTAWAAQREASAGTRGLSSFLPGPNTVGGGSAVGGLSRSARFARSLRMGAVGGIADFVTEEALGGLYDVAGIHLDSTTEAFTEAVAGGAAAGAAVGAVFGGAGAVPGAAVGAMMGGVLDVGGELLQGNLDGLGHMIEYNLFPPTAIWHHFEHHYDDYMLLPGAHPLLDRQIGTDPETSEIIDHFNSRHDYSDTAIHNLETRVQARVNAMGLRFPDTGEAYQFNAKVTRVPEGFRRQGSFYVAPGESEDALRQQYGHANMLYSSQVQEAYDFMTNERHEMAAAQSAFNQEQTEQYQARLNSLHAEQHRREQNITQSEVYARTHAAQIESKYNQLEKLGVDLPAFELDEYGNLPDLDLLIHDARVSGVELTEAQRGYGTDYIGQTRIRNERERSLFGDVGYDPDLLREQHAELTRLGVNLPPLENLLNARYDNGTIRVEGHSRFDLTQATITDWLQRLRRGETEASSNNVWQTEAEQQQSSQQSSQQPSQQPVVEGTENNVEE